MNQYEELVAEISTLRALINLIPEENCIDKISLESRVRVVIEKAILNAAQNLVRVVRTPPKGFSNESEDRGLWWTVDAERAVESLMLMVELGRENGIQL